MKKIKLRLKYWFLYFWKDMKLFWKKISKGKDIKPHLEYVILSYGGNNARFQRWLDWKSKEEYEYYTPLPNTNVDLRIIEHIGKHEHKDVMTSISYKRDIEDEWAPSHLTEINGFGDCEDQAILLYRKIVTNHSITDNCFICIVPGHAFLVVKDNDGRYWMFDNGHYVMKPRMMHEVLPYYGDEPAYMFTRKNFFRVNVING